MIFLELYFTFFQIGLFSFGGGYAAMPLIQSLVVNGHKWLSMAEFADLTTIAEMTPGPIAVNASTFVGQKMAGLPGAIICTLGCITPSLIIVLLLAWLYTKYRQLSLVKGVLGVLRPAVVAMIGGAALTLFLMALFGTSSLPEIQLSGIRIIELVLFAASLFVLRKWKPSPILIIFASAVIGTVAYLLL